MKKDKDSKFGIFAAIKINSMFGSIGGGELVLYCL
jgi:hypothetical protein